MADPINYSGVTYDQSFYRKPAESMSDYMQRLASQRAGGILGGGGMLDTAAEAPLTSSELGSTSMSCPTGYRWNGNACVKIQDSNDTEVESQYDRYMKSDERLAGFSFEDYKMQNALDRLTGRQYAGQGLFYGLVNGLSNWADRAEVKSQLMANGYTEAQADAMVNDPELASATNMLGRLGTMPTREYDYKMQNTNDSLLDVGKSIVDTVFGTDTKGMGGSDYNRQSPFALPATVAPIGQQAAYSGTPLLANGRTQSILAAQNAKLYNPFADINLGMLSQQAQQAAVAEQARAEAMNQALAQANATNSSSSNGNADWGSSGYHSDSSGSYTGGADYGGWTGVTADGSGNDWNSF